MLATLSRPALAGIYRARLDDGRWHFQHGPIDLLIFVEGSMHACGQAIEQAWYRFQYVLQELTEELPLLRTDGAQPHQFESPIARRMARACWPFHQRFGLFVTPMAAVAGSVAEEILACLDLPGVDRASVNNGGDIALFVKHNSCFKVGVIADTAAFESRTLTGLATAGLPPAGLPPIAAAINIDEHSGVQGIATSGWRGRSLSLGIADAVTVLAKTAAQADAAATMIANAVNVDHPGIIRLPADQVRDDSDLRQIPVTRAVAALPQSLIDQALDRGVEFANKLVRVALIDSAFLVLQGAHRVAGVDRRGLY